MLRVAHVLGGLDYGGVESMALRLLRGLEGPAFSHVVISMAETAGEREGEFRSLAEVVRCPYRRGRRLQFVMACAGTFRRIRPDRVLAYNFGNHAMVALAARLAAVPSVYVRVALVPLRNSERRWRSMLLGHLGRPFCRAEIAVSEAVRVGLVENVCLPASRIRTIPNGCEVEEIKRRAASARARRGVLGPQQILMVSRMAGSKDHGTALMAIERLRRQGCEVELVLAGDGSMRAKHEALAAELGISGAVRFLGNRTDIPELMAASDVLVHATHVEGFPNVLIEGMAAGVPIVATDIPPCREVLDNGRCGLLVASQEPRALADAIRRVLGDPGLREALTAAAAERVAAWYDIRAVVERYGQVLSAK